MRYASGKSGISAAIAGVIERGGEMQYASGKSGIAGSIAAEIMKPLPMRGVRWYPSFAAACP